MDEKELWEQLADIEHQRWSDWQKWCHKVLREECGSPELEKVLERWDKQIETEYKDLSEKEKDSDRVQVDRYFPVIKSFFASRGVDNTQEEKVDQLDLSGFEDFTIIDGCVAVVGSSVDIQDKEPGDLDLVLRIDPKYDYLVRNIKSKLEKFNSDAHVFCEPMGAADDYVPLYDLRLVRVNVDKVVEELVEKEVGIKCKPFKPFEPMKPGKKFYDVDEVVKGLY